PVGRPGPAGRPDSRRCAPRPRRGGRGGRSVLVRFSGGCSGIAAVAEVLPALVPAEGVEALAQERPQPLDRPPAGPPQQRPALRSSALSLSKASSMGLRSGLYGGRYTRRAPAASMAARTPARLWQARLSITTTSPGRSAGANCCST